MNRNEDYRDVNEALPRLCQLLLDAPEVSSRLGDTTRERTMVGITLDQPLNREILIPSRRANIAAQIAETMWVLAGKDDVEWLRNYLPRAEDFSDDGQRWRGAYGPRLRAWADHGNARVIDQLDHVVKLLRDEPTTRRAVMTIYDPARDTEPGKDIPCNNWLSFLGRDGYLDLHVATRSNDLIWGWSGINQFEWSVLLEIVADLAGFEVGALHFSITSLHLYDKHYERAESITKDVPLEPMKESPRFALAYDGDVSDLDGLLESWFQWEKEIRIGAARGLAIDVFPEPMMRSWLQVIAWYWTGDQSYLEPLTGTPLYHAALLTTPRAVTFKNIRVTDNIQIPFVQYVSKLHAEKNAAYGDSWKARGELFSILPNIARKVDRLQTGKETVDETTADTAIDLLVYLLKYRLWLAENTQALFPRGTGGLPHVEQVNRMLTLAPRVSTLPSADLIKGIRDVFDTLLEAAEAKSELRSTIVDALISLAGPLAYRSVGLPAVEGVPCG